MRNQGKQRIDTIMVGRGLAPSRHKARDIIINSIVKADGITVKKAGQFIKKDAVITLHTDIIDYVSRGGLKLASALDYFNEIKVQDKVCLDLGASTGGFSDVLLQRGASLVYAVDVGHSQLSQKIKENPNVRNLEKTNARKLNKEIIDIAPAIIVCDLSFISLRLALPPALALASKKADVLALIKPQFEVGKAFVGKGGIVRNQVQIHKAQESIISFLKIEGWHIRGIVPSPIEGSSGNQEFMVAAFR